MFQVRIHGRGGQGVVTASEMLAVAAFLEGRHAQAFPSFGSERTGAPVVSFCRIDDRPIRVREPVSEPNALIIQDPTLLHQVDVFAGLRPDGYVLINSARSFTELGLGDVVASHRSDHLCCVPAGALAAEHVGRPVPNAGLLGGFAALTRIIGLASVEQAIREAFTGRIAEGNVRAARAAYEAVQRAAGVPGSDPSDVAATDPPVDPPVDPAADPEGSPAGDDASLDAASTSAGTRS